MDHIASYWRVECFLSAPLDPRFAEFLKEVEFDDFQFAFSAFLKPKLDFLWVLFPGFFQTVCHLLGNDRLNAILFKEVYARKPEVLKISLVQILLQFSEISNKVIPERVLASPIARVLFYIMHEGGLQVVRIQCSKRRGLLLN